jgi:hypothetical protein
MSVAKGARSSFLVDANREQAGIFRWANRALALRAQGKALRAIANAVRGKGYRISHEGVAGVLRAV